MYVGDHVHARSALGPLLAARAGAAANGRSRAPLAVGAVVLCSMEEETQKGCTSQSVCVAK